MGNRDTASRRNDDGVAERTADRHGNSQAGCVHALVGPNCSARELSATKQRWRRMNQQRDGPATVEFRYFLEQQTTIRE